jgi:predicted metal-dependent hydrolase
VSTTSLLLETEMTVSNIPIQVIRKPIKNLHLAVYPPKGRVRVSAPLQATDDNIRLVVVTRLNWIKQQQAQFQAQPRQPQREMVSGETHYLWGQGYLLEVIERHGRHEIIIKNNKTLQLFVNPGTSTPNRIRVLNEWYRQQIKQQIPNLLNHWQPIIGEQVADWGIKKMKTKWGSCNIKQRRIWLNLELAKKPLDCLEYVVVHEIVHLLERYHNHTFKAYMNQFLPQWRLRQDILNQEPLGN